MKYGSYLLVLAPFLVDALKLRRFPTDARTLVGDVAIGLLVAVGLTIIHLQREELEHLSLTDALTGLGNFRAFAATLRTETARCRREGAPVALAYIDLDNFKGVNDRFGHESGNVLLRRFAASLRESVRRDADRVYRVGGDEFAVILPGASQAAALDVAERIRKHSREAPAVLGEFGVTLSVGLAALRADESVEDFLKRADALQTESKTRGKDRVTEAA